MVWSAENLIFSAIVGGTVIYFGVVMVRAKNRENAARSWPSATATVSSAGLRNTASGRVVVWFVRVAYSFTVNGEYYGNYTDRSVTEAEGNAYARWCIARTFPVRYKPGDPSTVEVLDEDWITTMEPPSGL
jgi:hypothetical protein